MVASWLTGPWQAAHSCYDAIVKILSSDPSAGGTSQVLSAGDDRDCSRSLPGASCAQLSMTKAGLPPDIMLTVR